ncbi:MAG: glutathione S-transferase family protein [Methylobacteriaceae bacterium]|nr:glutathione S-transferase family protein [Methylobacteriaceae bacterium]
MARPLKLIIANKAYSSWSVRPWLALAQLGIPFEEVVIPLDLPTTRKAILKHSPSGRCPALVDGDLTVWDSLAMLEYVAEKYPKKAIWPKTRAARAMARSLCAEMHAGFQSLRRECPMNLRRPVRAIALSDEAKADAARIEAMWAGARKAHGKGGPFLFGRFCAADAYFAPVVNRLHVYDVAVSKASRAYMDAVMATSAFRALVDDAMKEKWFIDHYEAI